MAAPPLCYSTHSFHCLLGDGEYLCVRAESRYLSSPHPLVAKLEAALRPGAPGDAGTWALGEDPPLSSLGGPHVGQPPHKSAHLGVPSLLQG